MKGGIRDLLDTVINLQSNDKNRKNQWADSSYSLNEQQVQDISLKTLSANTTIKNQIHHQQS